jgi:uncharacterized RDD family membrane protein YckC
MGSREEFRDHMLMVWIYIFIPHFFVVNAFLFFKGKTPGYKAYNIKLTNNKGEKPSLFSLTTRYIIFTISIIIPPLFLIMFFTKEKLGVHDILSGTIPQNFKS